MLPARHWDSKSHKLVGAAQRAESSRMAGCPSVTPQARRFLLKQALAKA